MADDGVGHDQIMRRLVLDVPAHVGNFLVHAGYAPLAGMKRILARVGVVPSGEGKKRCVSTKFRTSSCSNCGGDHHRNPGTFHAACRDHDKNDEKKGR